MPSPSPILDTIAAVGARRMLQLPRRWLAWFGGHHRVGDVLDPQVAALLRLSNWFGLDRLDGHSPAVARARTRRSLRLLAGPRPPGVTVTELSLAGPAGPLPLRMYRPAGIAEPAPALLYLHGGGWVIGDLDTHDAVCARLAVAGRCVVFSLAYRLAPEHKFPAAVEDALAGFLGLVATAQTLAIDPRRIAVGGDSAGGNLAAVIAQTATCDGWAVRPVFQLLLYPGLDMRRGHASHRRYADGFILTAASISWFLGHYLRDDADMLDPRASPLLRPELAGGPPAYIATAGFDPLCDEAHDYAARLRAVGTEVTLDHDPTLVHGFVSLVAGVKAAEVALQRAGAALAAAVSDR